MNMFRKLCAVLLVIGGINWGLIGLFSFDAVAWICGGAMMALARIIYVVVGAAAVGYIIASIAHAPEHRERH